MTTTGWYEVQGYLRAADEELVAVPGQLVQEFSAGVFLWRFLLRDDVQRHFRIAPADRTLLQPVGWLRVIREAMNRADSASDISRLVGGALDEDEIKAIMIRARTPANVDLV